MIKGVVFDLDDTLISEKEYISSGFRQVAMKIAKENKLDEDKVYGLLLDMFDVDSKNVFNRVLDKLNINYESKDIKELIDIYRNHIPDIKLYEDAKYIIEVLHKRDMKLGIITDGYKVSQRNKLEILDIGNYFEHIVVTDELGREFWKPHKRPYEIMKDKLELEYEEMVYVGDNPQKDFITANKLGINTIFINREDRIYAGIEVEKEYNAKSEIRTLLEIINEIEGKL